jgi:uncharacterized RDD family membrane protein YckC
MQAGDELLEQLKANAGQAMTSPAGKARRLLGGVIDYALVNAVFFGIDKFMLASASVLDPSPEATALRTALTMTTLIAAGYFIGCWMLFGATMGMRIAGIRVADAANGAPLSGGQAFRRFLVFWIIGPLAFLVMLVRRDAKRQAWYDLAGKTVVVQ